MEFEQKIRSGMIVLIVISILCLSLLASHSTTITSSSYSSPTGKHVGIYLAVDQSAGAGKDSFPTAQDFVNAYFYPTNEPQVFSTIMLYVPIYESSAVSRTLQIASLVDNNPNIKMAIEFGFNLYSSSDWSLATSFMSQLSQHASVGWVGIEGEHTTYDTSGCEFSGTCQSVGQAWNSGALSSSQLESYFSQFQNDAQNYGLGVIHYYVTFGPITWRLAQPQVLVVQYAVCDANLNTYGLQGPCSDPTTAAQNQLSLNASGYEGISGGLSTTAYDAWNPTVMGTSTYNTGLDNYINLYIKYASQYSDAARGLVLFETGGYQYTDDWYRSIFMSDLANSMTQYPSDWILPTSTSTASSTTTSSPSITSASSTTTTATTTSLTTTTTTRSNSTSTGLSPCSAQVSNPAVGSWVSVSCSGFPSSSSVEAAVFNNSTNTYAAYLYPSDTSSSGTLDFSLQITSLMVGTDTVFLYSPDTSNVPLSSTEFSTDPATTTSSTTSTTTSSTGLTSNTTSSGTTSSTSTIAFGTFSPALSTTTTSTSTETSTSSATQSTVSSSSESSTTSSFSSTASTTQTHGHNGQANSNNGQANSQNNGRGNPKNGLLQPSGNSSVYSLSDLTGGITTVLTPSALLSMISSSGNPAAAYGFVTYEITLIGGMVMLIGGFISRKDSTSDRHNWRW